MPLFALLLALAAAPALVNGKPITEPEVTKAVKEHIQKTLFHRQLDDKQLAEVRKKVLDKLITSELRAQEARRRGLTIPLVDVLKVAAAEEQNAGGREKFEAMQAKPGDHRMNILGEKRVGGVARRIQRLIRGSVAPDVNGHKPKRGSKGRVVELALPAQRGLRKAVQEQDRRSVGIAALIDGQSGAIGRSDIRRALHSLTRYRIWPSAGTMLS